MNYLHILAEDDRDELFYVGCVEAITGVTFEPLSIRIEKGGISEVRRKMRILLRMIRDIGSCENTFFLIAMDNDRCPEHPNHERFPNLSRKEAERGCRFCEIENVMREELGDRDSWPIEGAVAVPVQMIESWLLLILDPERREEDLPSFPTKDGAQAKRYIRRRNIPDQLKDLVRLEEISRGFLSDDLVLECISNLSEEGRLSDLADRSQSFALFKRQVESWHITDP